jgi:hypothetical protein
MVRAPEKGRHRPAQEPESDTLKVLIRHAAGCWHTGPTDRAAAGLLLQWCISTASAGADKDEEKQEMKRVASSAFSSLNGSERRAVALAVEVMRLKVDRKLLMSMTKTTA